jgi:hypothetical protein
MEKQAHERAAPREGYPSRGAIFRDQDLADSRFRLAGLAGRTQAEHTAHGDRQQAQQGRQQGGG